jgi:hypothetical protein
MAQGKCVVLMLCFMLAPESHGWWLLHMALMRQKSIWGIESKVVHKKNASRYCSYPINEKIMGFGRLIVAS